MPEAKKRELVAAPPLPVAERDPPEALGVALLEPAVEDQGVALGVGELAEERAGLQVERVDLAVAEVADEQGVAEPPEVVRGDGHPVRRVEQPLRGEPRDELAAEGELVDEAVAHARDVVVPGVRPAWRR